MPPRRRAAAEPAPAAETAAAALFVPVAAASLQQLIDVTKCITELTKMLVAPLGVSPSVQLTEDTKLDAAVRDRLAIGNMSAVELACEKIGISPGAHALGAAQHERAAEMRQLVRDQEEIIPRIFEPQRVVELPANATPENLLRCVTGATAAVREGGGDRPYDGAQARRVLEAVVGLCEEQGWTHEQLQALAEGYGSGGDEPTLEAAIAEAWGSWAALLPSAGAEGGEEGDSVDASWAQCVEDVEAAADALGAGRLLEARELLTYAVDAWEAAESAPIPAAIDASPFGGAAPGPSPPPAAVRGHIVEAFVLRADCCALEEAGAKAGGGAAGAALGDAARADLKAALRLDAGCSAAHFRLARDAAVAAADAVANRRRLEDEETLQPATAAQPREAWGVEQEAEAGRAARLAQLQASGAADGTEADAGASEGLFHAVAGVVIGAEQARTPTLHPAAPLGQPTSPLRGVDRRISADVRVGVSSAA